MIFYLQKLYLFVCRDKLFLKCHIQLNQLWFLMQCSLISGYFHDFTEERIMMIKVFPDDDLGPTAHDRKKELEKDTSKVAISTILMQDGQQHEEVKMSPEKSPLLPTSDSDKALTTRDFIRGQLSLQKKCTTTIIEQPRGSPYVGAEESFLRKIKSPFISSSTNTKFKPQETGLPTSLGLAKLGIRITLGP
ncbi:hypothetical protein BHE74_00021547 [Ensete ventricosum]|nr:hypothetical protein BHE74_00021547 [Ensete ventricosum]